MDVSSRTSRSAAARILALLDEALGKIPIVVDAQQQHAPRIFYAVNHDYSGREDSVSHAGKGAR